MKKFAPKNLFLKKIEKRKKKKKRPVMIMLN
jgi:hypothetical protein